MYCSSYLVVKNKADEACVCRGIRKYHEGEKCYDEHKVDDYLLSDYKAGNLSSLNPVDCNYEVIGGTALVFIKVEFNQHTFIIFYTNEKNPLPLHTDDLRYKKKERIKQCCETINKYEEVGDLEINILNLYNSKVAKWKQCELSGIGFSKFLHMYFGSFSSNPFKYEPNNGVFPLRDMMEFRDLVEPNITFSEVCLINEDDLIKSVQYISELQVKTSSKHRIEFSCCSVEIKSPIDWYNSYSHRNSTDGLHKRYFGKQEICSLHFCHEILCQKFKTRFINECKKAGVELSRISEDSYAETFWTEEGQGVELSRISKDSYAFNGTVNLPFYEVKLEEADYNNTGVELYEW